VYVFVGTKVNYRHTMIEYVDVG